MLTWTTAPVVGVLAILIGYRAGKMPCWKSWQGYVGLVIVAPIVISLGVDAVEALFDCVMLGVGFSFARRT